MYAKLSGALRAYMKIEIDAQQVQLIKTALQEWVVQSGAGGCLVGDVTTPRDVKMALALIEDLNLAISQSDKAKSTTRNAHNNATPLKTWDPNCPTNW